MDKRFLSYHINSLYSNEALGVIKLSEIKNVERLNEYEGKNYVFCIVTTQRKYHFSAPDDKLLTQWIKTLLMAVNQNNLFNPLVEQRTIFVNDKELNEEEFFVMGNEDNNNENKENSVKGENDWQLLN